MYFLSGYGAGPNNYNASGNYTAPGSFNSQGSGDSAQSTRPAGQGQGYHPYRR